MRGFTLVETLVAIALITITLTGPYLLAQGTLSQAYIARDELIASGLAQEGMEGLRLVRDSNYIATLHGTPTAWLAGLDGNSGAPNCFTYACTYDMPTQKFASCLDATCGARPLYLNAANAYTQTGTGNARTKFTRLVRLTNVNAHEVKATVTVKWDSHGPHAVTIEETLQPWQ